MSDIVLATMNARWSHASFGLRCLRANLGALTARSALVERTIEDRAADVVEAILAHEPRVVGLGVYIWNARAMLDVARTIKALRPQTVVVVGGPEVSHEIDAQDIVADWIVTGEGEDAFRSICERVLAPAPARALPIVEAETRVIAGGSPALDAMAMPYALYDDVDVRDRIVYVEASRGCPFTCSFCLSALDDGVRTFPLERFVDELRALYDRGLRRFKFVDRTFNLKIDAAAAILDFFLARTDTFAHFEMIPDRLPAALRERLARFADGAVQLEVGIQTFDDDTAKRISRKQDAAKIEDNLRFLAGTGVHVHADLIAGLPGEDLASFGRGFDRLYALGVDEIQVGILKRLRGAPLARDAREHPEWGLVFDTAPPYALLQSAALSFTDAQRVSRFARAFDLVHNSGRFPHTAALLLTRDGSPFARFLAFSDWLYAETHARHGIALARLADLLARWLVDEDGAPKDVVAAALEHDLGRDRTPAAVHSHLPNRQQRAHR